MQILLEQMRKKRKMTQQELSKKSGVPQPVICNIETGDTKRPRVDTMLNLAQALRCTIDDLITTDEPA